MKDLTIGMIVRCVKDYQWVYVGYRTTKLDTQSHYFVRTIEGSWGGPLWNYIATNHETIAKKFPELAA